MEFDINNINSLIIDVFKEVGNIGSGNAATALAKIINKKIDMNVPKVSILDFSEIPFVMGGAEKQVVGIYFMLEGDINGNIMFLLNDISSINLIKMIFNTDEIKDELNDIEISALSEVGNILAASYVNSLSELTGLNLKISVPFINIDMAGALLSVPAIEFGKYSDKVLFIETEFIENDKLVSGNLFLIPDLKSYDILLKSLGVN